MVSGLEMTGHVQAVICFKAVFWNVFEAGAMMRFEPEWKTCGVAQLTCSVR